MGAEGAMDKKQAETIRTMKYRYSGPKNGIGYSFSPVRYEDAEPANNRIFIYEEDFSEMLPYIQQKYPLADIRTGEIFLLTLELPQQLMDELIEQPVACSLPSFSPIAHVRSNSHK